MAGNIVYFSIEKNIRCAVFQLTIKNQWFLLVFHAASFCGPGYPQTYLTYIMEVFKKPKYLRIFVPFSALIIINFRNHFKMLNFPSFFQVFVTLQAINWEKTAHCSMFFPHRVFMSQKVFFKKKSYLIHLPSQPRNCYKFKIHSCTMFLIIR